MSIENPYVGVLKTSPDFAVTRDYRQSPVGCLDVDLSVPRNRNNNSELVLDIAADSFYCDANPNDGNCVVKFQDTNKDNALLPMYVSPGFIYNGKFVRFMLENAAQPGKKVRFFYGVSVDFQPGSVVQNVTTTNATIVPPAANVFYKDNNDPGANTAVTVLSAASNLNGAYVLSAAFTTRIFNADFPDTVFVSKSGSAPTSTLDGDVILQGSNFHSFSTLANHSLISCSGQLNQPIFVPAGHGIFYIQRLAIQSFRHARIRTL